jgi:hypothetical protein
MDKLRISPTISPLLIAQFRKRTREGFEHDGHLENLIDAAATAQKSVQDATEAHEKIMRDQTRTRAANMTRARESAFRIVGVATRTIDSARANALSEVARLEQITVADLQPPRDVASATIASEIRSALKALPESDRSDLLARMIREKDARGISAVISAPGFLSGISAEQQAMLREQYRHAAYPAEMERAARLKNAVREIERIGELMLHHVGGLTDARVIEAARASAAAADSAAAA